MRKSWLSETRNLKVSSSQTKTDGIHQFLDAFASLPSSVDFLLASTP